MDNKKIILVIPYRGIGDLIFHLPYYVDFIENINLKLLLLLTHQIKQNLYLKKNSR